MPSFGHLKKSETKTDSGIPRTKQDLPPAGSNADALPKRSDGPAPPIEAYPLPLDSRPLPHRLVALMWDEYLEAILHVVNNTPPGSDAFVMVTEIIGTAIREALRKVRLTALWKVFSPAGPIYILVEGGPKVDAKILEFLSVLRENIGRIERDLAGRSGWHTLGAMSASVTTGHAFAGRPRCEGLLFARSRILCATGPFPTIRIEPEVYRSLHVDALERSRLSVFSGPYEVQDEFGRGAMCFEAIVGPRRPRPRQRLRGAVAFLGGKWRLGPLPRR